MDTAKEIGIEDEVGEYQGDHLAAIKTGDPKPGYGMVEESQYNINEDREIIVRASNINYAGPALDKLPTDVKVKVMANPGDDDEDIYDRVADELEDRYGVKVSDFEMKMMESVLLSKDMREKIAKLIMNRPTKGLVPALEKYGKKFGDFIQKKMDEELR